MRVSLEFMVSQKKENSSTNTGAMGLSPRCLSLQRITPPGLLAATSTSTYPLDQAEDYFIFAASTDEGKIRAEELVARLFTLPGSVVKQIKDLPSVLLETLFRQLQTSIQLDGSERNARFLAVEADKRDGWADYMKAGLEREVIALDRQIKETRRVTTAELNSGTKACRSKTNQKLGVPAQPKRHSLFEAKDEVDRQRDKLIAQSLGLLLQ